MQSKVRRLTLALLCGAVFWVSCIAKTPDLTGWPCTGDADCGDARNFACLPTQGCIAKCQSQSDCYSNETCHKGLCEPAKTSEEHNKEPPPAPDAATEQKADNVAAAENKQTFETSDQKACSPSAEICNGLDDDCDGTIDNDLTDLGQPCNVAGKKGVCATGVRSSCQSGQIICEAPQATTEVCDGKDNDCDGQTDEDFELQGTTCENPGGKGECEKGVYTRCINGKRLCTTTPKIELCDGKDNNCNGLVDEGYARLGQPCEIGKGTCQNQGKFACTKDGKTTICDAIPHLPNNEICDGKDNNCDGKTDENCACISGQSRPCYSGRQATRRIGNCIDGNQTCTGAGTWGPCIGEITPKVELCNNKDDNCDGQIDNIPGIGQPCSIPALRGACKTGKRVCLNGSIHCKQIVFPKQEICDNGIDDNCDGYSSETCACFYRNLTAGVCKTAKRDAKGICQPPKSYNKDEVCADRLDNNCDGLLDRPGLHETCLTESSDCIIPKYSPAGARYVCLKTILLCQGAFKVCKRPNYRAGIECSKILEALTCQNDSDCNNCSTRIGKTFKCTKGMCTRFPTN